MVRRDRVFWAARKKVALVRDRAGKRVVRVGLLGATLLGIPSAPQFCPAARGGAPQRRLGRFPLCPHHRLEGAGGGGFPAPSPTFPPLQDKSQLLLFSPMDFPAVIQFLPGVGGWLGSGQQATAHFPRQAWPTPSGEGSLPLCSWDAFLHPERRGV